MDKYKEFENKFSSLQYPSKETIKRFSKDLHLNNVDQYTQDWEIEVANSEYLSEYIEYYNSHILNQNEKHTLMWSTLEAYNDFLTLNPYDNKYWSMIKENIIKDYDIHEDTIQYWSCERDELVDSFALTYLIRNIDKEN